MAAQNVRSITEDYIKALYASLRLVSLEDADRGQYKREQSFPSSRDFDDSKEYFTLPDRVATEMQAVLAELHGRESTDVVEVAAWLHQRFVQIHPFIDGMGERAVC